MVTGVEIKEAHQEDLPALIAITCAAMETDVLTRFLYSHVQTEAIHMQTKSLMTSLGARFTKPTNRCHIFKAVESESAEIVGWCLVRWEDGSWTSKPASKDDSFASYYSGKVKQNWLKLLGEDKSHVVLGALYVRPDKQGQGIGTQLVQFLYSSYHLHKELVIVQTRAMSESFYHKLGWITADSTDIDLSEHGGKGQGYGLHRSPQMLREPAS